MIGLVNSIVFLVVLTASCQASDDAFEAGNQTVSQVELATKIQERVHIYERSIIFWDTQDQQAKEKILKDLAYEAEDDGSNRYVGCPRIRYPLICDDSGLMLENVCYFRLRRQERASVLPKLVFVSTRFETAGRKCQEEYKAGFIKRP